MASDHIQNSSLQLTPDGKLKHFLTTEGLPLPLLENILDTAESFLETSGRKIKKLPLLRGHTVMNLFFEPSTRTRSTFELAAQRLSADILNMDIRTSATSKGESLIDMLQNLEAMGADMFVVRHGESGAAHFIAQTATPNVCIINAGDGQHAHPTQAMLDMFTIRKHKKRIAGLEVVIVGDILHSRVARSQIHALKTLGANIRLVAPKTLLPDTLPDTTNSTAQSNGTSSAPSNTIFGCDVYHDFDKGIKDADVVIMLRLQRERMSSALLPGINEYFNLYGLTPQRLKLAHPNAIVMHPGPINRGVEIASQVADGPQSVILDQVTNGIAVRMAVMSMCLSGMRSGLAGTPS